MNKNDKDYAQFHALYDAVGKYAGSWDMLFEDILDYAYNNAQYQRGSTDENPWDPQFHWFEKPIDIIITIANRDKLSDKLIKSANDALDFIGNYKEKTKSIKKLS